MSMLGRFIKQPVETEVYSMQFVQAMSPGDQLLTSYTFISRVGATWDGTTKSSPYTTTLTDNGTIIAATANITGVSNPPDGYLLYVSNVSTSAAITACGYSIPVRGAAVFRALYGAWVMEASTTGTLINSSGDQRIRTFVSGGVNGVNYEVQVTVTTSEGRTLQNEFIVKVKES